jgi:autotransporter-associated beta strand protein
MIRQFRVLVGVAVLFVAVRPAVAQTWTGAANGSWSNSLNWSPAVVPTSGLNTALTFGSATTDAMTEDITGTFLLNQMTFTAGGPAYTLTGNTLGFSNSGLGGSPQISFNTSNNVSLGDATTLNGGLSVIGTGTGILTFNGTISGGGGLTVSGAGTVALGGGSNTYTGNSVIASGTLMLANGTAMPTGAAVLVGGGQFNIGALSNASASAIGTLTVNGAGTFRVPGGNGNYYLNQLAMTGGTVDFTGTNDFWLHFVNGNAGITINNSSTTAVWVGAPNSRIQNDTSSPLTITVNSNGASGVNLDAGIALSNGGTNPNFVVTGFGTMRLTSLSNTANISVNNATLRADDMSSNGGVGTLGTGSITLNGNGVTLQYGGPTAASSKPIALSGFPTISVLNNGVNLTLNGVIAESAPRTGLAITGSSMSGTAGTVTLVSNNNYTGGTQVFYNGVLAISTIANGGIASLIGSSSNAPGNLVLGGYSGLGTLMLTGTNPTYNTDRGVTVSVPARFASMLFPNQDFGGAIGVQNAGTNLTISGQLVGLSFQGGFGGDMIKVGAGTLTLTNTTNNYANASYGTTTVKAGTLNVGAAGAVIPANSPVTVSAGATFQVGFTSGDNSAAPLGTLTLDNGTFRVPAGSPSYFLNRFAATSAGGTVNLLGSSAVLDFSGGGAGATINGNTLWSGTTSSGIINLASAAADLTIVPNVTLTNDIPLLNAFRILGGGTFYMTAPANGAAATYTVSQGRLRADDLSTPGGFSVFGNIVFGSLVLDGGILQYSGSTQSSSMPIALSSAGGTVEITSAASTLTLTGRIAGSGSVVGPLVKAGPGVLILANTVNAYVGGITVNGGRLDVGTDAQLGVADPTVNPAGTLRYTASTTTSRTFNLADGTLEAGAGAIVTYAGATVNGGFLRGAGTHAFTGGSVVFGSSTLNSSTVSVTGPATFTNFGNGGAFNIVAGLTNPVNFNGFTNQGSGSITVGATSPVNIADVQSYGTLTINPATVTENYSQTTKVTNTGTSPLYFNGGSRTFVGTPATAVFPSNWPDASLRGQPTFVAGIDLHGQNSVVAGGLLVNNGYIEDSSNNGQGTATIVADFGSLVKGSGFYQNSVITQNGGKFQAGNSPGAATFGKFVLGRGGVASYVFAIDDATGVAGPTPDNAGQVRGWGLVRAVGRGAGAAPTTGDVTWTATPADRLLVSLDTLVSPTTVGVDVPGLMDHFDPTRSYVWPAFEWTGAYAGPADVVTLDIATSFDTSGFANPVAGTFGWTIDTSGHTLSLTYMPSAVPEPGTIALIGATLGVAAVARRGRQESAATVGRRSAIGAGRLTVSARACGQNLRLAVHVILPAGRGRP